MGIYDRDYYQDNRSSFLGSLTRSGQVCKYLIVANVVIFLLQLTTMPPAESRRDRDVVQQSPSQGVVTDALILDTEEVAHGQVWRLITYAFLHSTGDLFHIVFNMLLLWFFGRDIEDLYGPREFLAFYLVSALLGGIAFELWGLREPVPQLCMGASGAVMAVMVLLACHYPRRTILFMMILPVPIWAFAAFLVLQDTLGLIGKSHSSTAFVVHLAGALFGFVYYRGHWRLLNLVPDLSALRRLRRRPQLRVYREEETPVAIAVPPRREVDEQLEAKVDAVLEKVAQFGQSSLSENERQLLLRASEIYRKKRS